jgi:hypothetical protein
MNGALDVDVGVRSGFGAGPLRFSTRLGGRSSSSDDSGAWLVLLLIPAASLTAGPWAAIQALSGHWGVAAIVAGAVFLVASPFLMFFNVPALFVGTSWGLYVFFRLGYWDLAEHLFSWLSAMPDPQAADVPYVDVFAVSVLVLAGAALEGLVLVAAPVLTSLLAAVGLHVILSRAVAGGRRRWTATQPAAIAKGVAG